ncbi:nitroreductase family deazaflavin-dependent oxidoreductase [Nocardia sp. NPDC051030]|uniref:nitroreductase family deazaflavin-dependent oxidoreductase n=1 Tax=Nocardia sp. NPDC051030 TaxID=3155162 RepID=UPI003449B814
MHDPIIGQIPDSLRYSDGRYVPERVPSDTAPTLRQVRRITRPLNMVQQTLFAIRLPRGVGVLTTTGRKSGQERRCLIKAMRDGDKVYTYSILGEHALWLKNIRANPAVRVRLRGGTFDGIARDLHDEEERRAAYSALCEAVHPFDYLENAFHRRGIPSRTKILELHRAWFAGGTPLVVELR